MANDDLLKNTIDNLVSLANGSIAAITETALGNPIIRLRAKSENTALQSFCTLRKAFPFAKVSMQTSTCDGIEEVEVILPTNREVKTRAWQSAKKGKFVPCLNWMSQILFLVGVSIWGYDSFIKL